MNNWNAGQTDMVELFRSGADVYSLFASDNIYHFPINKHDNPVERFVGKVAVLGLGYGMGANKFRTTLATGAMGMEVLLDHDEAFSVVKAYRAAHHAIVRYWSACDLALAKMLDPKCDEEWGVLHLLHNMIVLPNGMALQYPGLKAEEDQHGNLCFQYYNGKYWKDIWGGTTCENLIQALSRIVLFEQMLDINDWTKQFDPEGRVCLNVHDEIITVASDFGARLSPDGHWVNDSEAREYYAGIEKILRTPLDWCPDLPLDCEGGFDHSYSK
jgi:DNA polymerase